MADNDNFLEIFKGFLLLLGCHLAAGFLILALGFAVGIVAGNYTFIAVWVIGYIGLLFWQLVYVIPLIIWLQRKGKVGMIKGVILGAVITALLNGSCYLAFFAR